MRTLGSIAVVAALYLGREVLVLLALGAFVAFVLAPVAKTLEWARIPRGLAAAASVLLLAAAMGGVLWVAAAQGVELARRLPEYRRTLEAKVEELRRGAVATPLLEATDRLKELQGDLDAGTPSHAAPGRGAPSPRTPEAVAVRVVEDVSSPLGLLGAVAGSVVAPLGAAAVVLLLATFLLAYRTDVRERMLRLGPLHRIGVTAQALEEAGRLVARYLLANLAVNVLYGVVVGVAIHAIGVPSAWLWGLLCALLRFIPYVGTWIGAALPIAVSIAVMDGWGATGLVVATIVACDALVGNVVEPLAYGRRTGLSPLAIVLATVFWTWVWGVAGLLLAVPLTLCLAVVGRFVPGFAMFHVLLGDQPVLGPAERAYDRLVALDANGASRVASETAADRGPTAAHDEILVAALRRAEVDRRAGVLEEDRYRGVCDAVRAALEETDLPESPSAEPRRVLCVPAYSESDRVAGEILARHLASTGVSAEVAPTTGSPETAAGPLGADVGTLCVVALPPFAALRARHVLRRARAVAPDAHLLAVVLDPQADRARTQSALAHVGVDTTAFSLGEALAAIGARAEPADPARGRGSEGTAATVAGAREESP